MNPIMANLRFVKIPVIPPDLRENIMSYNTYIVITKIFNNFYYEFNHLNQLMVNVYQ
jgi:hypothetical protein